MLTELFIKVKKHSYDLFIVFCIACIAVISYNLGHIRALKKTPIQLRQNAAIFDSTSGSDREADIYQAGERAAQAKQEPRDPRVVVSKNSTSKKYHYSWCASGQRIKSENQIWFPSAAAAEAAGYTLAGNCQ